MDPNNLDANFRYDINQNILVAVDCCVFGFDSKKLKLLLFRRKVEPLQGNWSLIGTFLQNNTSIEAGAKQILYDYTGLKDIYLEQLKTYGAVDRDPVERVISIGFYSLIRIDEFDLKSVEAYDAKWFDLEDLPPLVLDHGQMVIDAISALRIRARLEPIGFNLLPTYFTIPQLQILYECIYQSKRDSRNFRKKVLSLDILNKTDQKDRTGSKKGAFLYSFKSEYKPINVKNKFYFDF